MAGRYPNEKPEPGLSALWGQDAEQGLPGLRVPTPMTGKRKDVATRRQLGTVVVIIAAIVIGLALMIMSWSILQGPAWVFLGFDAWWGITVGGLIGIYGLWLLR